MINFGVCSCHGKKRYIVNQRYNLCVQGNRKRLDEQKYGKGNSKRDVVRRAKAGWHYQTTRNKKVQQTKADEVFLGKIWKQRKHVCEYCGDTLFGHAKKYNFDHVLEKSPKKFPTLRYEARNIVLCCLECHSVKTSEKYTDRMKGIIYGTVKYFLTTGLLLEVGEVNIYKLKEWVIASEKPSHDKVLEVLGQLPEADWYKEESNGTD